jgi:RNA polymerase sigma factor (sigma-70 family)
MASLPETHHSLLVRLAAPEDAAAWEEFTSIYERAIYRYSKSCGLQDADAEEVVQQVLSTVHRKIGEWRPTGRPGAFRAWLLQTARRTSLKALRDRTRCDRAAGGTSVLEKLGQAPAGAVFDDDEARDWKRWAFCVAASQAEKEVEPLTWRAFWLTAVEQRSASETAAKLGVKIGSVYTAKCRVLARIREIVGSL